MYEDYGESYRTGEAYGTMVLFFVFFLIFGGFRDASPKYQVASYGSGVVVLDVQTGEAWKTECGFLCPINYSQTQIDQEKYGFYTKPEQTRCDNNTNWWEFFKRKIREEKKENKKK